MLEKLISMLDISEYSRCSCCGELCKKDDFVVCCKKCGVCRSCHLRLPFVPVGTMFPEKNESLFSTSVFYYEPPISNLIIDYKFNGSKAYDNLFASYMTDICGILFYEDYHFDMIAPVPLSKERLRERGYNQAGLLSSKISETIGIAHCERVIKRVRNTRRQTDVEPKHRSENVAGAFAAEESLARGRSIILIDDVYTTGNTLRECARALLGAGAERVVAVTIARKRRSTASRELHELLNM